MVQLKRVFNVEEEFIRIKIHFPEKATIKEDQVLDEPLLFDFTP